MNFDVGTAVSEAVERITTQVALVVVALYAVANVLQTAAIQDITREAVEAAREYVQEESDPEEYQDFVDSTEPILNDLPLALGLDLVPAIVVLLGAFVLSLVVLALAIDAFARRATSVDDLGGSRLLFNTLNLFVGGIAYALVVLIGSLFFLIPGLVFLVLFMFYPVAIVVEEENFIAAFGSSLSTVTDNVVPTILLVLLAIGVGIGSSIATTVFTEGIGGSVGGVLSAVVGAVTTTFLLAVLTRAYVDAHPDAPGGVASEPETAA